MDLNEIKWVLKLIEQEDYENLKNKLEKQMNKLIFKKENRDKRKVIKKEKVVPTTIEFSQKTKDIAKEYREKLIENQTEAEKKTKIILQLANINYSYQKIFYYINNDGFERFHIADFYLPEYNTVLEVDGGYHDVKQQKLEDKKRTLILKDVNKIRKVIRITNDDANKTDYCINKIKRLLTH